MENESRAFFNSPVILKNTPIRRMGLSRKRKSCCSPSFLSPKIQASGELCSDVPKQSDKSPLEKSVQSCTSCQAENNSDINYDDEIELLKKKITEAEEKLKTLQSTHSQINQLEDLIDLWKIGCKKAYLQFSHFLRDRQENVDFKEVLSQLGILETMIENFESDPEISFSD